MAAPTPASEAQAPNGPRRTALVTGASAGIGEALARVFAERGWDLVLTARREDRLRSLADELASRHRVRASWIAADLAESDAPARIYAQATAAGQTVDALVNNAGYGLTGGFLDVAWAQHARFIQVMMTAVVDLTYCCLPAMIERRYGRIINVASLAGLVPGTAGHTLYGASKAFVIKFSQSVGLEAARDNVHVTALCPGFTRSEFHDVNNMRELVNRLPTWMWMEAGPVAREAYDAVMRGDLVWVTGRRNRALALLARLVPEGLALAAMKRYTRRFRRTGRADA